MLLCDHSDVIFEIEIVLNSIWVLLLQMLMVRVHGGLKKQNTTRTPRKRKLIIVTKEDRIRQI